jgi:glycolate oxidase FAD binding subunit
MSAGAAAIPKRALDPASFAIGGVAPRSVQRPGSREELCEALRAASRDRSGVVPWGGGVSLPLESAPERYDLALDLTGLDRIVEYEPEDFTLTTECGVTIARLRDTLAARGQELPLEAAFATRATVGGAFAANASGPRRLRFGSPRDRILGARFALADGTLARTGGKVVKNVAGYGIHRLLCGSRGGLAILVEASLKLAPAPAARRALVHHVTAKEIADPARWATFPRLEPAWLTIVGAEAARALPIASPTSGFVAIVGLEDDAAWVDRQSALAIQALGAPHARVEGADASALVQSLTDLEELDGPRLSMTTAFNSPAAIAPLIERGAASRLVFHALAGRLHLAIDASEADATMAALRARGFALVEARGVAPVAASSPRDALLDLRARIRVALDPDRTMAFGDRWERG